VFRVAQWKGFRFLVQPLRGHLICYLSALEIKKKPSHRVAQWKGSSVPKGLASTAGFRYPVQPLHAQDRVV
jgi:hypothetical protein